MSDFRLRQPKPSFWNLFASEDALAPYPSTPPLLPTATGNPSPGRPSLPEADTRPPDDDTIFWAMQRLPEIEAPQHFLVCGAVGSGKTIAIRLLLQSIAHRFKPGWKRPEQLVVFDAKVDAVPQLAALGLSPEDPQVWILNPQDKRSAVWNVAEAVSEPLMARHFATLVVPEERQATAPYFADAARELVYCVVIALSTVAGTEWTLRDLLCALESRENIRKITARSPRAKVLAQRILRDDQHASGVLSTLGTKLGRFEQVAALWHSNQGARRFTIREFLSKPGVLILGNDPLLRDSFWPINAMLLKALSQHILRGPNVGSPRHWFILDEFRAMEKVECIHDLLNRGRSKGASVLLGIQSIVGLIDVYGRFAANDLLSACSYKTFLRLGDPETAEWAEKLFGKVRQTEEVRSESTGAGTKQTSVQYPVHERSLFIASFFLSLPFPRLDTSYQAVADIPCQNRTLVIDRPFDEVLSWCIPPSDIPPVVPFGTWANQLLEPWSAEEESRFCDEPVANDANTDSAQTSNDPPRGRKTAAGEGHAGTANGGNGNSGEHHPQAGGSESPSESPAATGIPTLPNLARRARPASRNGRTGGRGSYPHESA
jgi:hypothetical protein